MAQPATESNPSITPGLCNDDKEAPSAPAVPTMDEPVNIIDEVVTQSVVEAVVKGVNPDFELVDFSAELGTAAGDNYMSIMYAVTIEAKSRKTGENQMLKIMLKTMPKHPFRQQMINEVNAFTKEQRRYEEIFPAFVEFQKKLGIKEDELFAQFPKCYSTFSDGKSDYLALEDLRPEGFKLASRHVGLDFDHASLVVRNMAKLHAISFAMYGGDFHKILDKYPILEEKMCLELDKVSDVMKGFQKQSITHEAKLVRDAGFDYEAKLLETLLRDEYFTEIHRVVTRPTKYAVISHADCWTNNFLFKYSESTGKPIDLKLIDFQLARVSSRVIDLAYFLHTSPQIRIITERIEELLKIYHTEFTSFAKKLGYENEELTFDQLLEEWADKRMFGLAIGLMMAPAISANKEDIPDMENMAVEFTEETITDLMKGFTKNDVVIVEKLVALSRHHLATLPYVINILKEDEKEQ